MLKIALLGFEHLRSDADSKHRIRHHNFRTERVVDPPLLAPPDALFHVNICDSCRVTPAFSISRISGSKYQSTVFIVDLSHRAPL